MNQYEEEKITISETPIPPAALKALAEIDSATISNAIEPFKVRDPLTGYASLELRCQYPDLKPMVGYAVTCVKDTTTAGDQRPMRMDELIDVIEAAPKPASGLAISEIESLEPAELDEFLITFKGRKQLVKGDFVPYSREPIRFFVTDNRRRQEHELSLSGIDTEDISIGQETGDFTSGLKVSFAADTIKLNLDSSGLNGEPRGRCLYALDVLYQ